MHTHRHDVRDELSGVARFGSGGGDESRSTVLDTDMHKHEGVHTPIQPRRSGMIGHKQKWGRKTMVDRWYIGMRRLGVIIVGIRLVGNSCVSVSYPRGSRLAWEEKGLPGC